MAEASDEFTVLAGTPILWQGVAREYIQAANYLLDWYDVSRVAPALSGLEFSHGGVHPAMVLYAIAVENLLKAIRVAVDGSPVVGEALSRHFKHHKLASHADSAHVALSDAERDLLEHLTDFIEAGRYPVPAAVGGAASAWHFTYPEDVEKVWTLLERLEGELRATGSQTLPEADLRKRYRPPGYTLAE